MGIGRTSEKKRLKDRYSRRSPHIIIIISEARGDKLIRIENITHGASVNMNHKPGSIWPMIYDLESNSSSSVI